MRHTFLVVTVKKIVEVCVQWKLSQN